MMIDLGYDIPDWEATPTSDGGKQERPMKRAYPEIHIRVDADEKLPPLPEDEFYFIGRGKKVGYRDPVDEGADKSCDIAVVSMHPIDDEMAEKMMGHAEGEEGDSNGSSHLRKTMRKVMASRDAY